ncbi:hypothetical protein CDAR_123571 [Caerostris darwini]|uniref:Uncharacterized protein n=1 Tax=Caerostris darwini TaxID=1538125 RepID=A0AAV4WVA9_9ARAC|nr:hypothetical protein CDAR_123571 [Caerostris darwini]
MVRRLSTKCSMANNCPFPCEQEILDQACVLLAGQHRATTGHGLFCMDNSAGYCVKFYVPSKDQAISRCTFTHHCWTLSVTLWPHLQTSKQLISSLCQISLQKNLPLRIS